MKDVSRAGEGAVADYVRRNVAKRTAISLILEKDLLDFVAPTILILNIVSVLMIVKHREIHICLEIKFFIMDEWFIMSPVQRVGVGSN